MDNYTEQSIGICDLPEEILGIIFDHLTVSELKNASLVCLHWSHLVFSGRRLNRVRFYVENVYVKRGSLIVLRKSQRRYRHIRFSASDRNTCEEFVPILQRFERFLVSLDLEWINEVSLIKRILLEVPNLKALSLNQHKDMKIRLRSMSLTAIDFRTITPNLQAIEMVCDTESVLNVYRHFSGQLKTVTVFLENNEYMHSFCEIVFPKLLEIKFFRDGYHYYYIWNPNSGFIAGANHLQRATLECGIDQTIINSLVEHCREITFLSIRTDKLKRRSLLGLANLKHLNTIALNGMIYHELFDACKPIPSLQALQVNSLYIKNQLLFFKGLCRAAPRLTKLCINFVKYQSLPFICNNLLSLKWLKLSNVQRSEISGMEYLDRLPHLFKLSLINMSLSKKDTDDLLKRVSLHKITVLSIHCCYKLYFPYQWTVDDFLLIPQLFPSLKMLKITGYRYSSNECIKTLRSRLPNCTIIRRSC